MNATTSQGLLGPAEIRRLAQALGVSPTKSLGQNFVVDANTVRRIVRAADLDPADVVLEVGPGLGSLTLGLLDAAARVVAVEVDPVLAAALPAHGRRAPPRGRRAARRGHRRRAARARAARAARRPRSWRTCPTTSPCRCCCTCWSASRPLRHGLVMVQAEVADRLAAGPGEPAYGVPSVKAAWYGRRAPGRRRAAGPCSGRRPTSTPASSPSTRREPPASAAGRRTVFAVVDAAFAQRRKTLRAALAGLGRLAGRRRDGPCAPPASTRGPAGSSSASSGFAALADALAPVLAGRTRA